MPDAPTLNNFSCTVLSGILASGEWYETPGQLFRAGQILEEVLPDIPKEPTESPEVHKAWSKTPAPWRREPTIREREVITRAVKFAADKKILRGSIHLLPLLVLAGLKPEE
jgi:hypothetical protein